MLNSDSTVQTGLLTCAEKVVLWGETETLCLLLEVL